ncbi:glycosyltransferase [Bremerella cremea]|uniref:glycosyltransferase n=1 Tax=Bremerella cremea TaxID=1031537 RepID=UPI001314C4F5|nr:glycosyltransferase [Bremerella cremea]
MLLLIDAQALQTSNSRNRGVGRYSSALINGIHSVRPDWKIEIIENTSLEPIASEVRAKFPIRAFTPPLAGGPKLIANRELNEAYYADWICSQQADVYLCCSIFEHEAVVPSFTTIRPPRTSAILYDLIPLLFSEEYLRCPHDAEQYTHRFRQLCQMDTLLAISESTRNDFLALEVEKPPQVINIRGAISDDFTPTASAEKTRATLQRLGLPDDFILYVGGCDFRKNMPGAITAHGLLPEELQQRHNLVITCAFHGNNEKQYSDFIAQQGQTETVQLTGWVSKEDLQALYQSCRLFFFPSLYEGLGLPVLEALQSGAPVVCSNTSSLPEYGGRISFMADPESPSELAAALQQALSVPRTQFQEERLEFARQFSWQNTGERAAQVWEAQTPQRCPTSFRPRIAWVSPLPPVPTEIAQYSLELINELKTQFDIELVVDAAAPQVAPYIADDFVVITDAELSSRHAAAPFDLFVYHLGNHAYHDYMLPLLHRHRGVIVLHDFFLGGLFCSAIERGYWPISLEETLAHTGNRDLAELLASGNTSLEFIQHAVPLNQPLFEMSDSVIVHSRWAWQRVKSQADIPVSYFPRLHDPTSPPLSPAEQRQQLSIPENAFVIAALGVQRETSRIESLLQAVHQLPSNLRKECLVILCGADSAKLEHELAAQLAELQLTSKVHCLETTSAEVLSRYAVAADVCVQLQYPIRNEISPELLLALGQGACCLSSTNELPEGVSLTVRTPHHEVDDLRNLLIDLYNHPERAQQIRTNARHYVQTHHSRAQVIPQFSFTLSQTIVRRQQDDQPWLDRITEFVASTPSVLPENLAQSWADLRTEALAANVSQVNQLTMCQSSGKLTKRKISA